MRRLFAIIAVVAGFARAAAAQGVLVAPHAVYLDHRTRSGSLTLYNPGAEPVEIAVSFFFGYPVTDSLGHFSIATPDSVQAGMPSAADWIEAFPRRLTLAPLQRQTVRLLARPPQGLAGRGVLVPHHDFRQGRQWYRSRRPTPAAFRSG